MDTGGRLVSFRRVFCAGTAIFWLALVCGCQTVSIPEISPAVKAAGVGQGATEASLQNGRRVFSTRCTSCHGAEPIGKYSSEEWKGIINKMEKRAKLTSSQKADVLAFVLAARQATP